ncbi:peptidase G1 [Roridomyces roridus]|uniref:Peptidase G1 n=1 Tax=Roridomyces roridus TaxID=1738132 RepID=A0AAD7B632_9AGAR|nr:peptidase G1 [Roridomyces roridus]
MFFAASLYALLATTVLAAPRGNLESRIARRRGGLRQQSLTSLTSNTTHAEFSSNWAGASFESAANTYKSVTGTFVVPTPKVPSGKSSSGSYAASAWVGIDGDTCATGILQTGIDFNIANGRVSFDAWYEYFPAASTDFSGISISAGDTIKLTATVATTTSGTVTIENVSTGVTVSKSLTSSAKLCLENAEWIVEDFEEGNSLVPFANFGTVTFTNAVATTQSGTTVSPSSGAVLIDIEQGSTVLTSVSTGTNTVTVAYV